MNKRFTTVALIATIALCAGCGGAAGVKATSSAGVVTHTAVSGSASTGKSGVQLLKTGVRSAIRADDQLSIYVLWNNRLPEWAARSTRGPALAALRTAAATRAHQGIRIKSLSGSYTIQSLTLAPSLTIATAVVLSHQRVAPYESGRRLGRAISATDHARIILHRLGDTNRFIVWEVSPVR